MNSSNNGMTTDLPKEASGAPTYWLTRFLILRLLGFVYAVAFLTAINQILPLIGSRGLTPMASYIDRVTAILGSRGAGFRRLPSLFWFIHSDSALLSFAWTGFILACVVVAGFANGPILAVLWILYMSFVHLGQEWYGYGWEIQLLETGFLAIFLCPLIDARPFPKRAPPLQIIILFRCLIFRIMLGAGMIKLRGDEVWRNASALYYHFETQPLPGPLSRWFHFLPRFVLGTGVWYNFLAELIAPFFVFGPRLARQLAGSIIIGLQVILIFSGNLSFLNWLTIIPALACFDDGFWSVLLPESLLRRARAAMNSRADSRPMTITAWIITASIALLSIRPVLNILSPGQVMNGSFDPLDLVNTYGAFGSVERYRLNIVFEGTYDNLPDDNAHWIEYSYKALPGPPNRRCPQIAPYQLRLDWQMWFAAMATPEDYPWTYHLVSKLLKNDAGALSLFASNPFPLRPPKFIRAVLYRYSFAPADAQDASYWHRKPTEHLWLPALSLQSTELVDALKTGGWVHAER